MFEIISESECDPVLPSNYLELPADLSGSSSKNRFRWELLWGLYRIFEIYDDVEDFVVIFDYVCDIEVHTSDSDSYYQIKTRKATKTYTTTEICKTGKSKKTGEILNSILGKLYLIKKKSDTQRALCLAIVADVGLSYDGKEYSERLEQPLVNIDDEAQTAIVGALEKEFPGESIDLRNILYIRSYMDLANPEESVRGKIVKWFPSHKGCEVKYPDALYKSLIDLVRDKASFEWKPGSITELVDKKGISKTSLGQIIELHAEKAADGVELSKQWISNNIKGYKERIEALSNLSSVLRYAAIDDRLSPFVAAIEGFARSSVTPPDLEITELISYIQQKIQNGFPKDYTPGEIRMLILVILKRLEEEAWLS